MRKQAAEQPPSPGTLKLAASAVDGKYPARRARDRRQSAGARRGAGLSRWRAAPAAVWVGDRRGRGRILVPWPAVSAPDDKNACRGGASPRAKRHWRHRCRRARVRRAPERLWRWRSSPYGSPSRGPNGRARSLRSLAARRLRALQQCFASERGDLAGAAALRTQPFAAR